MNFREKIKEYREGTLPAEERAGLEEEFEKYRAFTEYYIETEDDEEESSSDESFIREDERLIERIRRHSRRKSLMLLSLAILLSISCVFLFSDLYKRQIRPFIGRRLYYDPHHVDPAVGSDNISLKLATINEIYYPGKSVSFVAVEEVGIGRYKLKIAEKRFGGRLGELRIHEGQLDHGEISFDESFAEYWPAGSFKNPFEPEEGWSAFLAHLKEDKLRSVEKLRSLPDYLLLQSAISFTSDLSAEEIARLIQKYPALDFTYIGVRDESLSADEERRRFVSVGFSPQPGSLYRKAAVYPADSAYPFLTLEEKDLKRSDLAEVLETHFVSLLRYQLDTADRERFRLYDSLFRDADYYRRTLEYIEKNGLQSYGVAVEGKADEILRFFEEESCACIYIQDAALDLQGHL
ncbi:MAG: anti sigma factor C-terminal domain-containing protein [Peptostreptococcaceae bacterium]|nr:anti sigma factor C-terminal domain-containing protein [Peptostreptococcaceae bacterium]